MIISQDLNDGKYQIKSYTDHQVTINEAVYKHSLIVGRNDLMTDWPVKKLSELNDNHLSVIISLKPAIVLLGTGSQFQMPKPQQLALFYQNQIGVESMDTGAACRTFMALLAEGRNVVAALIIH